MTAVVLGAIRTLINFHSCSGICLVKRYYSQDSLVFWADALILSKKIFLHGVVWNLYLLELLCCSKALRAGKQTYRPRWAQGAI